MNVEGKTMKKRIMALTILLGITAGFVFSLPSVAVSGDYPAHCGADTPEAYPAFVCPTPTPTVTPTEVNIQMFPYQTTRRLFLPVVGGR